MLTKIQKLGNSLAIKIPKSFASNTNIKNGSKVDVIIEDGEIIIKKVNQKKYSLDLMISKINKKNLHKEMNTGEFIGKEIW